MSNSGLDLDGEFFLKVLGTGVVVVLATPFLVIEPGPLSEAGAFLLISAIWGVDLDGGG